METEALAGDISLWLIPMSASALGSGCGLWWAIGRISPQPLPEVVAGTWVVVVMLGLVFLYKRMQQRAADRARAWLEALPFAGAWSAYTRTLGKERWKTFVHLRVQLQRSLVDTEARRISDAARGLIGNGTARCSGDLLEISSPELKSHFEASGDRESRFGNIRVHAWVRRALGAVLRIHREQPVVRVDIDVRDQR